MGIIGWVLVAIVISMACLVLYASDKPGHRRRKPDPRYQGPERRTDVTERDLFERPAFSNKYCHRCGKLRKELEPNCPVHPGPDTILAMDTEQ